MANRHKKEEVSAYLDRARDYGGSHHDNVQARFDRLVDERVTDPVRRRDLKDLYPVVADRCLARYRPSLNIKDSDLPYDIESVASAFLGE